MKRLALFVALALPAAASAATVERERFRYEREVTLRGTTRAQLVEPDGPMYEHAAGDFSDVRFLDARGEQIPWRHLPADVTPPQQVQLLNSGQRGNVAVALLDLGPEREVHDRVTLDIPQNDFVGRVVVFGADNRGGPYTRLGATGIYDVGGAERARSTTAVFAPTDHRFLRLEATGVRRIAGATVTGEETRPRSVRRTFTQRVKQEDRQTVITLDFRYPFPVDTLQITSTTPRYERAVEIETSEDGSSFTPVASARIFRFEGSRDAPIPIETQRRYVRVTVVNGDDPPLAGLRIEASAESRALVLEPNHENPVTMLYGGRGVGAPSYEFARLPFDRETPVSQTVLGPERRNAAFEPAPDTRSFAEKNDWLVEAALAAAALVVGAVGLFALRRRA